MKNIEALITKAKEDKVFNRLYPTQRLVDGDRKYYVFASTKTEGMVVVLSDELCDKVGLTKKFDLPYLELKEREIAIFNDGSFCYKDMAENYDEVVNTLKYDDYYDLPDFYRVGVMHNEYIRSGFYVFNKTTRLEVNCYESLVEIFYTKQRRV